MLELEEDAEMVKGYLPRSVDIDPEGRDLARALFSAINPGGRKVALDPGSEAGRGEAASAGLGVPSALMQKKKVKRGLATDAAKAARVEGRRMHKGGMARPPLAAGPVDPRKREQWRREVAGKVEALAGFGVTHADIAAYVGIREYTLTAIYRGELDLGLARSNARLAQGAFAAAFGQAAQYDQYGNKVRDETKPDYPTLRFLCRVRLGWREMEPRRDPTNPPIPIRVESLAGLTDGELAAAERVAEALAGPSDDTGGDSETRH